MQVIKASLFYWLCLSPPNAFHHNQTPYTSRKAISNSNWKQNWRNLIKLSVSLRSCENLYPKMCETSYPLAYICEVHWHVFEVLSILLCYDASKSEEWTIPFYNVHMTRISAKIGNSRKYSSNDDNILIEYVMTVPATVSFHIF